MNPVCYAEAIRLAAVARRTLRLNSGQAGLPQEAGP